MAFKSIRVSDLTGTEGADEDFVTLVVRQHPDLEEAVQLDVLPGEVAGLKGIQDLVVLEVRNGETTQVVTTKAEFAKLHPKIGDVLKTADGLRGRRKGYRPPAAKDD